MSTARVIDYPQKGICRVQWFDLDAGETGVAADIARWSGDKTVQITATGTSTITMQGSNDGGTTWSALRAKEMDADSAVPLSALGTGLYTLLENPLLIRPVAAAGDTSNIVITLIGQQP